MNYSTMSHLKIQEKTILENQTNVAFNRKNSSSRSSQHEAAAASGWNSPLTTELPFERRKELIWGRVMRAPVTGGGFRVRFIWAVLL